MFARDGCERQKGSSRSRDNPSGGSATKTGQLTADILGRGGSRGYVVVFEMQAVGGEFFSNLRDCLLATILSLK